MQEMSTKDMRAIDGGRWRCSKCGQTYFWKFQCQNHINQWHLLDGRWGWGGKRAYAYWVW